MKKTTFNLLKSSLMVLFLGLGLSSWGQTYDLVTSNAQLEEGAEYIILGQRDNNTILVMTTTQNPNNRAGVVISGTTLPTTLEAEANYAVFELGLSDGHWTFYDAENEGFLYAASSGSNHLKTRANDSDGNSRWEINIGNDNIASVVAQGDFTRNVMQLNTSNPLFSCYGSASQAPVYLYKKGVASTDPILNTSETEITGLGYMEGNASVSQSFSLSGMNLEPTSGNITVTAPANFQVSTDDVSFNNSLNIAYSGGTLASTDVYVRLSESLAINTYNGNITISGGGASDAIVSVEGIVTAFSEDCGFENFDNAELTASYANGSFVGNGGITWTYIASRDENGDANDSGIDGNAIMLRRASDNSSISSSTISNGIGNFSVKLYKGFTGSGNRQVELFVNGISQGTSTPFNDFDEHIFEVNNINIEGDFTIEIKNITSNQIIIDNISWTCYSDPTVVIYENEAWTGTPSITTDVIIRDLLIIDGDNQESFSAKTLTLEGDGEIFIESGSSITVEGVIETNGNDFIVESGANLVQIDPLAVNSGDIEVHVTAETEYFGYNIFSSPVAGQTFADFSEITTAEILTYSYDPVNGDAWVSTGDNSFETGLGYMFAAPMTAPIGFPLTQYNREFTGVPNNGTVQLSGVPESFKAVGNPYPSAIDADLFFTHNANVGAIYVWANTSLYDYEVLNDYIGNNYIAHTALASVGAEGGNLEAGQGFVVATSGGTIEFTNAMRLTESAGVFYKTMQDEKHIFKLNLSNENNELNQIAIGYTTGATEGFDAQIDGKMFGYSGSALYSLIANDDSAYVIQGRSLPFADVDVVPLGFRANTAGTYTVSLANFNGLFAEGQDIFIKDNVAETEQNLKNGDYTFVSENGTFENRFVITYKATGDLSVNTPSLENNWVVYSQDNGFQIEAQGFDMKEVVVYDMLGRTVYNQSAEGTSHTIEQVGANGVLIVKVLTADNQTLTRKVVK